MADEHGFYRADLIQKFLQRLGQRRDADSRQRLRVAVAWHIPCDGAVTVAERGKLPAPCACGAADTVQEHQRRRIVRAGGFIAEAAVSGSKGVWTGHAISVASRALSVAGRNELQS